MKKRLLAMVLCVAMLFALAAPVAVFAEEELQSVDYSDNLSLDKGNLIIDPDNLSHLKNSNYIGSMPEAVTGSHVTWQDTTINIETEASFNAGPTQLMYKSNGQLKYHFVESFTTFKTGTTYVYSIRLKNAAPDKCESPLFGMSFGWYREAEEKGALVSFPVENTDDFQTYSGYHTAVMDRAGLGLGFAYPDEVIPYTAKNARISMDISNGGSLMVAEVAPVEISASVTGESILLPGATTTVEAELFNQLGEKDYISQDVDWLVLNEDRTSVSDGLAIAENEDGTATVTAVKEGRYVVLASAGQLRQGLEIIVAPPFMKDSAPGEDPLYEVKLSKEGDTTMGIFDALDISASLVDSNGDKGDNVQSFDWYVIDETRTQKLTDTGIVVNVSEDTASAEITLNVDATEGRYYVVAESLAQESLGMLKAMEIVIDKTGTIEEIINHIGTDDTDKTKENLDVYLEILEISADYVSAADEDELCDVVKATVLEEAPETREDIVSCFERAALTALYNIPSEAIELFAQDGTFNYAGELAVDKIDTNGVTLYAGAYAEMTDAGKASYRASLLGKGFDTWSELYEAIKEGLVLSAIANPKDDGVAYLDTILTEENLALVGISADKYFSLTGTDAKWFKKTYLQSKSFTIETLASTLKGAGPQPREEDEDEDEDEDDSSSGGNRVSFGGGGSYTGGSSQSKEEEEEQTPAGQVAEFTDVPKTHWASADIHYLRNIGVIDGVTATTYEPDAVVTREQFLKLIIEAFNLGTAGEEVGFDDVNPTSWYAPYIRGAVARGITNGNSASTFGVGQSITREDACVMINRALSLSIEMTDETNFTDSDDISEYARSSVAALSAYGIINGVGENQFAPKGVCTRAQAAKIISGTLRICNSLGIGR